RPRRRQPLRIRRAGNAAAVDGTDAGSGRRSAARARTRDPSCHAAARRSGRRNCRGRCVHRLPRRLAARGPRPRRRAPPCLRRGSDCSVPLRRAAVAADRRRGRRNTPRGMTTPILLDCDPGHDDAIALLLALASPELELLGVTTVAGNQSLDKTTANAIRILDFLGRHDIEVAAGAERPLVRDPYVAAYVHGETGLDGPDLPPPQR